MTVPRLEVADLFAGYRASEVLRDVSLSLPAGGVAAVLGANGAGKTTLLRAISGAASITAGTVSLDGEDITGRKPHAIARRGIAHVPEGRQVFAALTVRDNLLVGATRYLRTDKERAQERTELVLELFPPLRRLFTTRAGALSGGEQQMVAVGRALMNDPAILMIDEPSLGLAPMVTEAIYETLDVLRARGLTILLVEQNASLALGLATTAYVLEAGTVALAGAADELESHGDLAEIYLGGHR